MARLPHPLSPPAATAALLGAALWALTALPCAAQAQGETGAARDATTPAAEPPFDPSPLPPIELPRREEPPPRAAPQPEPTPEATPAPAAEKDPGLEELRRQAREAAGNAPPSTLPKPEERSPGCLLLQVGLFTSDAGSGFTADVGIRARALSARWAYRLMFSDSDSGRQVSLNSGRLAWHKEFNKWAGAWVGGGFGSLEERAERYWDGTMVTTGTATVLILDGGLLVEYGPVSLFGLGLELLVPVEGSVRSAPTVLLTATISPLVLLRAL